ncbi:hypothetical protein F4823DRAFT_603129 [Ustulina deusta]|nr:hypothetical protein F4823DRAFT_603129 [Ustulina deusta]
MASHRLWLLANPYQLATLFLGIAVCLLAVVTTPPSSAIYLLRADYSRDAGTSTVWIGSLGYCKTDANNDTLTRTRSTIRCSSALIGYDVEGALQQDGMTIVSVPEASTISIFLTRGLIVLNTIAIALCLVSTAAHQAIRRRPTATAYVVALGSSLLALLFSGIAFLFEHALESYIASSYPATDATFTTTAGPLVYAMLSALAFQLAACVVGFYSCIGGKYRCEGGLRLEDEESLGSGVGKGRSTIIYYPILPNCPF